jgi:CDP-6-deoxy-D-xylo-4-hexulose-3-dehydrase
MNELDELLSSVKKYVDGTILKKAPWKPGDMVNYAGPIFSTDEYEAAIKTILSGWLALGDLGAKFERKFPRLMNKEYGVLVNSGSSANLLMLAALTSKRGYNLPKGTKVLMPIAGFPTTLNPTLQLGFEPVFVDIELDTLNLDVSQIEKAVVEHDVKVITFAHVLGNPPNMDEVMRIVEKYNLILLEDCCDALGSTYDGKPLGSFGEFASCSFYPAHHVTMGEGGFVSCKTSEQETIVKSFREWGRGCYCSGPKANALKCGTCKKRFSNWIPALKDEVFDHKYVYDEIGFNLKPIEMQAAMGLEQLKKLDYISARRKENYAQLFSIFEKYEEFFHIPRATEKSDPSWFAFPLTIRKGAPFKRDDIIQHLEDARIQTRPYFAGNIMLQPAYDHLIDVNYARENFPNATYAMLNTFFLGTSPVITKEQIDYIGDTVDSFFRKIV